MPNFFNGGLDSGCLIVESKLRSSAEKLTYSPSVVGEIQGTISDTLEPDLPVIIQASTVEPKKSEEKKMADDLDVEALLEAPFRKDGNEVNLE